MMDNDDEQNTQELRQEQAVQFAKPIGHVLYWQSKGRAIDGKSPIVILALLNKNDLDEYFLSISHYLKQFTKRPKLKWPPNDHNGRFIIVTGLVMRELEAEIIARFHHPGERARGNRKAVVLALFDFGKDPDNLIIVMGMVPQGQSPELIMRLREWKPRLVYKAEWMNEDFIESFEDWALGA
jgi:hypothetical protein